VSYYSRFQPLSANYRTGGACLLGDVRETDGDVEPEQVVPLGMDASQEHDVLVTVGVSEIRRTVN